MKNNNCILNLLKLIILLQNNSSDRYSCDSSCSKPYLGPSLNCICYNTRVITLYTKDGSLFTAPYNSSNESSYFRVNNIDNNCVTLLILRRDGDSFFSTNEKITVNINCICAIKCITDISLNCL